ncbi:MAG TPA: class I SAM-dependent methyltransferase [Methylocystis sp.]|nr:class I SAM-dependent methyltransferase [Methylocystis sp.]
MQASAEQVLAGQAIYTKRVLRAYDLVVLGVSNHLVWRCPTTRLRALYDRHVSASHLDVGVGTGYFLDRCQFPTKAPRVALMDLNQNALDHAAGRIARYRPETYRRNVLQPIAYDGEKFNSVGVNYLLHCLPGDIAAKAVVFDHLKTLMKEGATLFGSTLLRSGVECGWAARRLMSFYNRKGVFANARDDSAALRAALESRFDDVEFEIVGCAALFSGRA